MFRMPRIFARLAVILVLAAPGATGWVGPAVAQTSDQAFIQIEALPDPDQALARIRELAPGIPDLKGFSTNGGWHVLVIGPLTPEAAAGRLAELRRSGLIPRDSFVTDGVGFGPALDPAGAEVASALPVAEPVAAEPVAAEEPVAVEPVTAPDETKAEALASEKKLSREERQAIQAALAWYGHYAGKIDGAFGPGTRASMQAWQEATGVEATGVLTSLQRAGLTANHQADQAELGMELVSDPEAGIEIQLPLGLVGFDRYDPPFARYGERAGSGVTVLLISEPGDIETLSSLYDLIQTLDIMPPDGERSRGDSSFEINGVSATVQTLAYGETVRGMVKGYIVTWDPARADQISRALAPMRASFRSVGDQVLDPGMVPLEDAVKSGVLAGMTVRKPVFSRSGVFVDAAGHVLTLADGLDTCARLTVDFDQTARVTHKDAASGLAVLTPDAALSPFAVANWGQTVPKPGRAATLAGFSFGERLPAAALTIGRLEEAAGLTGEAGLLRLSLPAMAGDLGGPVLDESGAVIGILVPNPDPARKLPEGVAFARDAITAMSVLTDAGLAPVTASGTAAATPDAMAAAGMGMTTLVSCWKE